VARALLAAALRRESVEESAEAFGVTGQTVRNCANSQGPRLVEGMLKRAKEEARRALSGIGRGRARLNISIDWTEVVYYGEPVEGVTGGKDGHCWSFATAVTRAYRRTWILAFTFVRPGMSKEETVRDLLSQVEEFARVNVVTMDAGFYGVGILELLSRYRFIMAVPIRRIGVNGVVDTQYTTDSGRRSREEQASFRPWR